MPAKAETVSLIFRLAVSPPALAKLGSGFRGLAQDARGGKGESLHKPKGLLPPQNGCSDSGIFFCNTARYGRRLYFFIGNIVKKAFLILKE